MRRIIVANIASAYYPALAVIPACTSIAAILAAISACTVSACTAVAETAAVITSLYAFSRKHTSSAPFFCVLPLFALSCNLPFMSS
jgi:hypothetical protein